MSQHSKARANLFCELDLQERTMRTNAATTSPTRCLWRRHHTAVDHAESVRGVGEIGLERHRDPVLYSLFALRSLTPHREFVAVRVDEVKTPASREVEGLARDLPARLLHLAVYLVQRGRVDYDQHSAGLCAAVCARRL